MANFDDVTRLSGSEQGLCVAAVTRADGSVHASVVNAGPIAHPVSGEQMVAFVVQSAALKFKRVAKVGRGSLTFRRGWRWVGVEGAADIIGPDNAASLNDIDGLDLPTLLRNVFKAAGGTHDDWDEFDRVMAAEARAAVFVAPERIIGNP